MEEEMLDVVDEFGDPTGETVERSLAHLDGIRHRTSHVWICRTVERRPQLLLQKRSAGKDSFPGCYDISSAGHIPAGCGFMESALRELKEELGIEASPDTLEYCGRRYVAWDDEFHGIPYHDRQVTAVYLLRLGQDFDMGSLVLQEEEVESVLWMDFEECMEAVRRKTIKHCIDIEELEMIADALGMDHI